MDESDEQICIDYDWIDGEIKFKQKHSFKKKNRI